MHSPFRSSLAGVDVVEVQSVAPEQTTASEIFERFAAGIDALDPDGAALVRRCAHDPAVLELVPPAPRWDVPKRLLAAAQWLVLSGAADDYRATADPWPAFRALLLEHAERVARFIREQPVQTNEVQRCFALLPIFLTVARQTRRPLDLIELGASAGLNLLWDRYRYAYASGAWGPVDAGLVLSGEERAPVPGSLLSETGEIRGRIGIDLNPIDVTSDEDVILLRSFTGWPRQERLMAAIAAARRQPPTLLRGDYLELLPGLLEARDGEALTVVYQTISTIYLTDAQRLRLRRIIDAAGEEGPLAWISTPTPEEHGQRRGDYPIELTLWPGGERRIVARMDNPGEWLEWVG